ncbi:MAG: gfo/Idh/MocA family oxidoreductase [Proteobacteria bacterium]|nr:gfo/Idh/MocA family oxidoreductase [Pseudomonadota bacterium]
MKKYNVGIIGCGAILPRHLEAIEANKNFKLVAICDIQHTLVKSIAKRLKVKAFTDYTEMVTSKDIDFVVIATPNSLHTEQALFALQNGCDILVEKPVAFDESETKSIIAAASKFGQKAYCVLQVRLNPTVQLTKKLLEEGLLGEIRGVNLVQRWQRPLEYFTGWRAEPSVGGGTLYECGIHYLDILQYLFGKPKVLGAKTYEIKHKSIGIEDTIYALFDFGNYGGTCEVTIATEPQNIECSIAILGANGYVKLGGKALNIVESAKFLSHGSQLEFEKLQKNFDISTQPNSYGSYQGSCPNHPFVYQNLNEFEMTQTLNVIGLIDEVYTTAGIAYRRDL